jgi:hypothetical protein
MVPHLILTLSAPCQGRRGDAGPATQRIRVDG